MSEALQRENQVIGFGQNESDQITPVDQIPLASDVTKHTPEAYRNRFVHGLNRFRFQRYAKPNKSAQPASKDMWRNITDLQAGHEFVIINKRGRGLYAWGKSAEFQLGTRYDHKEQHQTISQPTPVIGVEAYDVIKSLSCGKLHAAAVTTRGLYVWGTNNYGQLGVERNNMVSRLEWSLPVLMPFFLQSQTQISAVACGEGHTIALDGANFLPDFINSLVVDRGRMYSWGLGQWGQLGNGGCYNSSRPTLIESPPMKMIAAGYNHSLSVDFDGNPYSWGLGTYGQLGHQMGDPGVFEDERLPYTSKPVAIPSLNGGNIDQIVCGSDFSLFRDRSGRVFSSGYNLCGQCGQGNRRDQKVPYPVIFSKNDPPFIVHVAAGSAHCAAVSEKGELWTWGSGMSGKLGHGTTNKGLFKDEVFPRLVESLKEQFVSLAACGDQFTVLLLGRPNANFNHTFEFSPELRDVHFVTRDGRVSSHRAILSCRSGKFKEMIGDTPAGGSITVGNVSSQVLEIILRYLYDDVIPHSSLPDSIRREVIENSEKFGAEGLSERMEGEPVERQFEELLHSNQYSDVSLISADDVTTPTHRVLLSYRSPFFKSMFGGRMKETEQKEVKLQDIEGDALNLLLQYIYTGNLSETDHQMDNRGQALADLLQLASEYNMTQLMNLCEIELQRLIDGESVLDILMLAQFVSVNSLIDVCLEFIAAHQEEMQPKLNEEELKDIWDTLQQRIINYKSNSEEVILSQKRMHNQSLYDEEREDLSKRQGHVFGMIDERPNRSLAYLMDLNV
ncbi:E3 ubiquitin-protein ligase [Planoprotostelium fungivorum]|uniref:E3 ubiquitin-protein ligase n=1 Tax=Planoprotostelium fungivorum TaxID=1890364 RepID=A0A2P6MSC8_9EUKA|nr:E3 ubiquitin-protein ligase [Planoprotostelium fungivorum]